MKNIETKTSMTISGEKIKPILTSSTPITTRVREWNLSALETILTVDSLMDDETRKSALHQRRRNRYMFMGAVVGGLVDADKGSDSIVDGILLGAAFGAICTSSPAEPKAQVGLLFSDGSHLALEVNKDEYTQLQALAARRKPADESKSAFTDRCLDKSEADSILTDRASKAFIIGIISAVLMGVLFPLFGDVANPDLELPSVVLSALPYIGCIGFIAVTLASFAWTRRLESYLKGDKETDFYSALNDNEIKC